MPVTIPKKPAPAPKPPVKAAPPPPAQPALTLAQVQALLDKQAAEFAKQIDAVTRTFTGALTAAMGQPKDKPSAGWDFKVEYLNNGDIDTIRATPRKPS